MACDWIQQIKDSDFVLGLGWSRWFTQVVNDDGVALAYDSAQPILNRTRMTVCEHI